MLPHNYLDFQLSNTRETNIKILISFKVKKLGELINYVNKMNECVKSDSVNDKRHQKIPNKHVYLHVFF